MTAEDSLRPNLTAMDTAGTRFRFCIPEVLLPERVYRTADGVELHGWAPHPGSERPHLWIDVSGPRTVRLSAELGVPLMKRDKPQFEVSAKWRMPNAALEVGEPILVELELINVSQGTVATAVTLESCNCDSQYDPNFRCEVRHRGSRL